MKKTTQTTHSVKSLLCRAWALIGALAMIFAAHTAFAQSVGVQFVGAGGQGINNTSADAMTPSQTAGAPFYAQANWNNFGQYGDSVPVTNSVGAPTSLFVNWDSGYAATSGTAGLATPDGNLFDGFLLSWGPGPSSSLGNSVYNTSINDKPLVYVSGINSWYQSEGAEGYSVVLYINGFTYWELSERWIQSVSGDPLANTMVGGPDLTPHLFDVCNANFNGTYLQVPATATNSGNAAYGYNYEVFTGLTNDAILIRNQCNSGYGGGINGFQIVPILKAPPTPGTPTFLPASPVYALTPVTVTETASVDPFHTNLWYQWFSDNATGGPVTNAILNATNSTLNVIPANNATTYNIQYVCMVSNVWGTSNSPVATLTVNPAVAPYVTQDTTPGPGSGQTTVYAYVGGSVTFSAAFGGTPGTYLWQSNSVAIAGATNTTLTLTNLQLADSASYDLMANNTVGSLASTPASLVVLPDPPAPNASEPYAYEVFTNEPWAYWRLNETGDNVNNVIPAYDSSGNNFDGVYGTAVIDDQPGPQAPAYPGFETTNTAAVFPGNTANGTIVVPSLDLNNNAVTITAWIYPTGSEQPNTGLLMYRNGNDAAGFGFGGLNNGSQTELGYTWNTNSPSTYNFNSGLYPPIGQWSFVVLTITPTNATIYLYYTDHSSVTNLSKVVSGVANTPESFSGGTVSLGGDSFGNARTFQGTIDEVAVFNKSLSESQVQNLFLTSSGIAGQAPHITQDIISTNIIAFAGQPLSITVIGDGAPVPAYQWQSGSGGVFTDLSNGGGISGANSSTLTFANNTSANNLNFRVVLTNVLGSVTSSVVAVSLVPSTTQINAVLADSPVAFWLLNETNDPSTGTATAYDHVGGFNGTYGTGSENAFNGVTGPLPSEGNFGFPTNNGALETFDGTANSYVTAGTLGLTANTLTITAWINPGGPQTNGANGVVMLRDGTVGNFGNNQFGIAYYNTTTIGVNWNNNYWNWNSGLIPPSNTWSFVAMVVTPTAITEYLANANGLESNADTGLTLGSQTFDAPLIIGGDPYDLVNRTFNGKIAQVAVFTSALSQTQVQQLYSAGAPQIQFSGSRSGGNLNLNWNYGGLLESTNVTGPWVPVTGATSPYTVPTTNAAEFFRVGSQ